MSKRLNALFYTFLAIFALTAIVTLLGVTKVVLIEQAILNLLLGAFLIELAGVVVALFRGAPFFTTKEDFVSSVAHSAQVIDELTEQISAVAEGRTQVEVNRHHGIVIRKDGNDLVAYRKVQVISGEQLKSLSPEQQEVVQTYEASMNEFKEQWKELYSKRAQASSERERNKIDKQLAFLAKGMQKDLHGVLDFLAGQDMVLADHYLGVRDKVDKLASQA